MIASYGTWQASRKKTLAQCSTAINKAGTTDSHQGSPNYRSATHEQGLAFFGGGEVSPDLWYIFQIGEFIYLFKFINHQIS
jgi:hypothetical protein